MCEDPWSQQGDTQKVFTRAILGSYVLQVGLSLELALAFWSSA